MTNPQPTTPTIEEASAIAVPRRLLCYGGQSWCSQLMVNQTGAWFKSCTAANKGAAGFWLWVCDQSLSPVLAPVFVPASSTWSIDRTFSPRLMPGGIYVCATSDPVTRTLIAANDAWFELAYEIEI
jgi:hypothetical protein